MSLLSVVQGVFGDAFRISRGYSTSHDGIDLVAKEGTPVYAVASGTVEYAKNAASDAGCSKAWACGGGNVVNINIGDNRATQYAHLQRFTVASGQTVRAGQLIGYVGHTGAATGPHLHFGLWDKNVNKMINPQSFLEGKPAQLKGFADVISFPVGHIITESDIHDISMKLEKNHWFANPVQQIAFEEFMKQNALGKAWTKDLQNTLAVQAGADASNIGNATDPLGAVGGAITGLGATLVTTTAYILAVVVVIVGIIVYTKSSPQPVEG